MSKYLASKLISNFYEDVNHLQFWWMKFWIGFLFIWKLLSRDFGNIHYWPENVINGYPIDIYQNGYVLLTAIPIIFDLVTFHFVHWFKVFPNLEILQTTAITLSILFIISPIRLTQYISIFLYLNLIYLWGFVFRLGQDIDAVFLLLGSLFVFCCVKPIYQKTYFRELRFGVLCIFVIYYFFSGFNKIVDLNYLEWFKFDLISLNKQYLLMFNTHKAFWWPVFPSWMQNFTIVFSVIGAFVTYLVHISAPALLFDGSIRKILLYILFYVSFHFLTIYVGIFFQMNFFAWLLLIPIYKISSQNEERRI